MDIVHQDIEDYLAGLLPSKDPVLKEMERLAVRKDFPIVGNQVGRVLRLMARLLNAGRIFEFGSGFGYSAYWFALGMKPGGEIVLTDDEAENAELAGKFMARGDFKVTPRVEVGDAIELIDRQEGLFDILFIDCEKARYPAALEKALPRLRSGGLLIADNVLWSGRVVRRSEDPSTEGILRFSGMIAADDRLLTTILPLRDGVSISLKS
jgi:caffeoyl-CoA O-methyltransferase